MSRKILRLELSRAQILGFRRQADSLNERLPGTGSRFLAISGFTFLLARPGSRHTAICRWAPSPRCRSSAHYHRKPFPSVRLPPERDDRGGRGVRHFGSAKWRGPPFDFRDFKGHVLRKTSISGWTGALRLAEARGRCKWFLGSLYGKPFRSQSPEAPSLLFLERAVNPNRANCSQPYWQTLDDF